MDADQFQTTQYSYTALGNLVKNNFASMVEVTVTYNDRGDIEILNELQSEANRMLIQYSIIKPERNHDFILAARRILNLTHSARRFFRATRTIKYEKNGRSFEITLPNHI